ncbi:hypothetical protein [Candidatus Thiosymbion oneisti]|uniref:hypothetical protein n=1 Tax=Candidatus Thiosymbion oneisti TaxID=589554 RepID=UPI000AFF7000|nr:hypothetical protein [Candidatus Thiosymbion oneisti]
MKSLSKYVLSAVIVGLFPWATQAKNCSLEFFFCGARLQFEKEVDRMIISEESSYVMARKLTYNGAQKMHEAFEHDYNGDTNKAIQAYDDGISLLRESLLYWDEVIAKNESFVSFLPGKTRPAFTKNFLDRALSPKFAEQATKANPAVNALSPGFDLLRKMFASATSDEQAVISIFSKIADQTKQIRKGIQAYIEVASQDRALVRESILYKTVYVDSLLRKHEKHALMIADEKFHHALLYNMLFIEAASLVNMDVAVQLKLPEEAINVHVPNTNKKKE